MLYQEIKIEVINEALPDTETGFKVVVLRNASLPTPFAGLTWVVHTADAPIFTVGEADRGMGLEDIAEDGDDTGLVASLGDDTGLISPLSPGVWTVHDHGVNQCNIQYSGWSSSPRARHTRGSI